jgi:hypothetical protein
MSAPAAVVHAAAVGFLSNVTKGNTMITHVQLPLPGIAPTVPGVKTAAVRFGQGVWSVLLAIGAGRARSELLRVARLHDSTDPQLAARLRRLVREDWLTHS